MAPRLQWEDGSYFSIFLGVCDTPRATTNFTSNGARMGMPAILIIAGHTMRSVSRTSMRDKARKFEVPVESAK